MLFEELDYRPTDRGTLSLRRRRDLASGEDVFEIKLDDEYLMSSAFTAAEIELGRRGMAETHGSHLEVVIGGLGLGYTARAALDDQRIAEMLVIDALPEVIEWHRDGLLPLGPELAADPRCRLVEGNFFAMVADDRLDPESPGRRFDAVLVDIDHAPDNLLHPDHAPFYTRDGLARLADLLKPGGVFALWSNDPSDPEFSARLDDVFAEQRAEEVHFALADGTPGGANTIYMARTARNPRKAAARRQSGGTAMAAIEGAIEYVYSAHSAYAYLGSRELIRISERTGRRILHRPTDLRRIVPAYGAPDFKNRSKAHLRYFFGREIERWAEHRDAPVGSLRPTFHDHDITLPNCFLIAAMEHGHVVDELSHVLLEAHWRDDADLADPDTLARLAERVGVDPAPLLAAAGTSTIRTLYERYTDEAIARGVPGSPAYFVDGDMFYGQDRLEMVERACARAYGRPFTA